MFIMTILVLNAKVTNQYFSYDDCNKECKRQGLPCNMVRRINTFTTPCVDFDDCTDNSNDEVPCISDNRPTVGGSALWPIFKQRIKPTPVKTDECLVWKISALAQTMTEMIIGAVIIIRKYRKYRTRQAYESIPEVAADNPYQPTIESIPPTE